VTHPDELLSAHLDGELGEVERRRVASHLVECERCRTEISDLARARAAVRALPLLELPTEVAHLVGIAEVKPLRRRPTTWVGAAAAAAAAVFVAAAAITTPEPQQITPPELTALYGAVSSNEPALNPVRVAAVTQAAVAGNAR